MDSSKHLSIQSLDLRRTRNDDVHVSTNEGQAQNPWTFKVKFYAQEVSHRLATVGYR
jgi:hypothetical protein